MAWTFRLEALKRAPDALRERGERTGDLKSYLESIGRAQMWLDQTEAARATFAARLEISEQLGSARSAEGQATIGGWAMLAGEPQRARPWLEAAREAWEADLPDDYEPELAGVRYLLGDLAGAAAFGDLATSMLASARLEKRPEAARAAREALVADVRSYRAGPHENTGFAPWVAWDWIAESFRVEAEVTGAPVPTYLEMLRATKLLKED